MKILTFIVFALIILLGSTGLGQVDSIETESRMILSTMRKAPYLIYNGNNTEMQLLWQLTSTDTCTLEWGTDTLYSLGNTSTTEYGNSHQHTYTITSLNSGTKYYYKVSVNEEIYTGSFRSAPNTNETSIKFMVYGDTRSNPASHDQLAAAMVAQLNEDENFQSIVLSVGDLVNNGNNESDWDNQFFNPSYPNIIKLLAYAPYQVAIGNHEGTGQLFVKYFPYPFVAGRYWSFDYGPAHFVIVDQYTSYSPGSAQLAWVENDLASTNKPWKFIYLHEPGWSAGGHSNNTSVQNYIQPLCEQYGVPIVFAGHNHYYARAVVNGIQHITTGGGGAPLYTPDPNYPNVVATAMAYHFCNVEIDGGLLHFTALKSDSTMLDEFTIDNVTDIESSSAPVALDEFILYPAYPNPFNPSTTIEFALPYSNFVTLKIYSVLGDEVATLVSESLTAGKYRYDWDASSLASGVYLYRIQAGDYMETKKMLLLR